MIDESNDFTLVTAEEARVLQDGDFWVPYDLYDPHFDNMGRRAYLNEIGTVGDTVYCLDEKKEAMECVDKENPSAISQLRGSLSSAGRRRASINEIPSLQRRQRGGRGFDRLHQLDDGRVIYFDLDPHDHVVFVLEVVEERRCPTGEYLDHIIRECVEKLNREPPSKVTAEPQFRFLPHDGRDTAEHYMPTPRIDGAACGEKEAPPPAMICNECGGTMTGVDDCPRCDVEED